MHGNSDCRAGDLRLKGPEFNPCLDPMRLCFNKAAHLKHKMPKIPTGILSCVTALWGIFTQQLMSKSFTKSISRC